MIGPDTDRPGYVSTDRPGYVSGPVISGIFIPNTKPLDDMKNHPRAQKSNSTRHISPTERQTLFVSFLLQKVGNNVSVIR